jgi:hypothetical protein
VSVGHGTTFSIYIPVTFKIGIKGMPHIRNMRIDKHSFNWFISYDLTEYSCFTTVHYEIFVGHNKEKACKADALKSSFLFLHWALSRKTKMTHF